MIFIQTSAATATVSDTGVSVYLDGERLSYDTQNFIANSVTYVPVSYFCRSMNPSSTYSWDENSSTGIISAPNLNIQITAYQNYMCANERYFYLKEPSVIKNDTLYAPVRELSKAFGATVQWDAESHSVYVSRGSGYIESGSSFYNSKDLYWLSRIISAESKGEPLRGKIAVGNVILNRVRSKMFPNTIYEVIFDSKNGVQFQPTKNKSIYSTPTAESVIAAKLCLEGYSLSDTCLFFFNPASSKSNWISRNCSFVMNIGHHSFYA